MSILDRVDPKKRSVINTIMQGNSFSSINKNRFLLKNSQEDFSNGNKTLTFTKVPNGYKFINNYLHSNLQPEDFIKVLQNNILHQINHLENIQKILWGIIIYGNIPDTLYNAIYFSNNGLLQVYNNNYGFLDDVIQNKESIPLFVKIKEISRTAPEKPKYLYTYPINFEQYIDYHIILENETGYKPDMAFSPKSHHAKIEYVQFLKNWAQFD